MSWCQHTRGEVTPTVKPEYFWDYCPICGMPKDKDQMRRTVDEIFSETMTKMIIGYTVLFIILVILFLLK